MADYATFAEAQVEAAMTALRALFPASGDRNVIVRSAPVFVPDPQYDLITVNGANTPAYGALVILPEDRMYFIVDMTSVIDSSSPAVSAGDDVVRSFRVSDAATEPDFHFESSSTAATFLATLVAGDNLILDSGRFTYYL